MVNIKWGIEHGRGERNHLSLSGIEVAKDGLYQLVLWIGFLDAP
jgi:hypothetical protein